jgi:hypothetical protein
MSGLHVLTDPQIRELLENLTVDDLETFRNELKGTLHAYSTGTNVAQAGLLQQPERITVDSEITGTKTLYMPSTSPGGHAVKGTFKFTLAPRDPRGSPFY